MAIFNWSKIGEQEVAIEIAVEASNFEEILFNFNLKPEQSFQMFKDQPLSPGKRLYFAVKGSIDDAVGLLLKEDDAGIRAVIKARLVKERENGNIG
jgi:hypothetical protein